MFELSYNQQKKFSELSFKTGRIVLERAVVWSAQLVGFIFKYLNLMIRQTMGK